MNYVLAFLGSATIDYLYILWFKAAIKKRAIWGGLLSGLMVYISGTIILFYVSDKNIIHADALGHAVGSAVGIRWNLFNKEEAKETKSE